LNLVLRTMHRCSRGYDLGPHCTLGNLPHTQRLDRGLVESGHRTQRSRDQVEFVLDYEVGRREWRGKAGGLARFCGSIEAGRVVSLRSAEQRTSLPDPRERCELVNRRDKKRGKPAVERLVHGDDGKRPVAREVTFEVRTDYPQLARLVIIR